MTNTQYHARMSPLDYCGDCGRCFNTIVVETCPACQDYSEVTAR